MDELLLILNQNLAYSLDELVELTNRLLPRFLQEQEYREEDGRRRETLTPRLVRHLTAQRLVTSPRRQGREAIYGRLQLLQLLVVRRLMSQGYGTSAIGRMITGLGEARLLERLTEASPWSTTDGEMLGGGVSAMQYETGAANSLATYTAPDAEIVAAAAPLAASAPTETNSALAYLRGLRHRDQTPSGLKRYSQAVPVNAPEPRWIKVEIQPGVEILVREDAILPTTPYEWEGFVAQLQQLLRKARQ